MSGNGQTPAAPSPLSPPAGGGETEPAAAAANLPPRDKLRAAYRRQTELVRDLLSHTKEVGRLEAELGLEPAAARKLVEEATADL